MIEIRPVILKDLASLRKIAIETTIATFEADNTPENMDAFLQAAYNPDQLEKDWRETGSIFYMAWEDSQAAGFSRLRVNHEVENYLGKNTIEIQRLYVHPEFQGKNTGSLLLQRAMGHAMALDKEWIWLGVWERNFKAQKFYAKWGFEKFGEHIFYMGDDAQTDWLLKKRLVQTD